MSNIIADDFVIRQKIAALQSMLDSGYGRTNKPLPPKRRRELEEQVRKLQSSDFLISVRTLEEDREKYRGYYDIFYVSENMSFEVLDVKKVGIFEYHIWLDDGTTNPISVNRETKLLVRKHV